MAAREVIPQWDVTLILASIGVSLLGAFTSTQLMCQAKTSRYFTGVIIWTALGSLTFGFCSIWSLHEVAMLAYLLDLRIGIDVGLTSLSAFLAVMFTFVALASDAIYERYSSRNGKLHPKSSRRRKQSRPELADIRSASAVEEGSSEPLLPQFAAPVGRDNLDRSEPESSALSSPAPPAERPAMAVIQRAANRHVEEDTSLPTSPHGMLQHRDSQASASSQVESDAGGESESYQYTNSPDESSRRSSSFGTSTASPFGLGEIMGIKRFRPTPAASVNPFLAMYKTLVAGLTTGNIAKGFFWAIAITSMHYVGIMGLEVPQGYVSFTAWLVVLSFAICWVVCVVGCILLLDLETHLGQQLLFSVVATTGVAAMHFTGMRAATFYSYAQPTSDRGYPPKLATAIAAIAISTCLAANLLLAHTATVSRNKLAEIVFTRKKLWMAIAQKESAETAAAARSEFIASASHEIRTPLHHLQGYSDLLSRTELTEEGRLLLYAIQRATKTLSLITNNVLDWSRLEKDGEATCRPVALDLRTTCESIITLLPNQDEEDHVEILVAVSPNVPHSLFIDETYIHRILMNLLSNALKFTSSGYILLSVEMKNEKLVAAVTDTGCGVPSAFLPQLFEPFKQAQVRGRARGTGLGLSIIKQLLRKMQGTIEVDSKYQDEEDVGPGVSGSTFTVTIPVQPPEVPQQEQTSSGVSRVAIFHDGNIRALHGLKTAWEKFGYDVIVPEQYADTSGSELQYIWADLSALKTRPQLIEQLSRNTKVPVLIPYDSHASLHEVAGLSQAPSHIVPIQKPVLLHTIKKSMDIAGLHPNKSNLPRAVRFDPVIQKVEHHGDAVEQPPESLDRQQSFAEVTSIVETVVRDPNPKKGRVVLLVEDNPINCKLGKKMLQSLGYQVVIAEDGVLALELITKHDAEIDAILMDQSMPRKDGLTATKEIRAMERDGVLSRTHPIIALTAIVSNEAQNLFKLAGADDFMAKPLSLGRLESTLATHLRAENST